MTVGDTLGDGEVVEPSSPESLVFRLSWASITNTLISGALLRDYFLTHALPPVNEGTQITVLTQSVHVTLLTSSLHSHTTSSTHVYLLPPLPPSLEPQSLLPISDTTFRDPAVPSLLSLALNPLPLLRSLALPPPQTFLIHAPRGAGITSTLATISHQNRATFIHLPTTYILRHVTTPKSLHQLLLYYLSAARIASPAIIALDDAPFLFPRQQDINVVSFIHFVRYLAALPLPSRVAVIVCAAPGIHAIHPRIVEECDIVLPLAIDPSGEWALQVAAKHTCVHLKTVRSRVATHALTTISDTIRCAANSLDTHVSHNQENSYLDDRWQAISRNLGGMSEPLKILRRMLLYPKTKAVLLRHFKVMPARGLLLYGPPGTGKTHLVREAAAATNYPVFPVDAAGLARGEVGASERLLTQVFTQAESVAPCIVFLDEIDALFATSALGRLVAVFALRMDITTRVIVIAATNKPWMVSEALLRPGRFEHIVKVPLPSAIERRQIAKVYAAKMELDAEKEGYLCKLASGSDGFSGADIAGACRRAAMSALCRSTDIGAQDLRNAFAAVQPSIRSQIAQRIDDW